MLQSTRTTGGPNKNIRNKDSSNSKENDHMSMYNLWRLRLCDWHMRLTTKSGSKRSQTIHTGSEIFLASFSIFSKISNDDIRVR